MTVQLRRWYAVPSQIPRADVPEYRALYVACLTGIVFNILFAFVMAHIGQTLLVYWSCFSVLLWSSAFALNQIGLRSSCIWVGCFELYTHTVGGVLILGAAYGFQFFLLACICIIAAFPAINKTLTFIWGIFALVSFLMLQKRVPDYTEVMFFPEHTNVIFTLVLTVVAAPCIAALLSMKAVLLRHRNRLSYFSYHDSLTGLRNRRYFYRWISDKIKEYQTSNTPFSIALLDLDGFKNINDTKGHALGDDVLVAFGAFLSERLGEFDLAVRWGGEEFLLVLHNCEKTKAEVIMLMLTEELAQTPITEQRLNIAFSYGVEQFNPRVTVASIIASADKQMYKRKQAKKDFAFSSESV